MHQKEQGLMVNPWPFLPAAHGLRLDLYWPWRDILANWRASSWLARFYAQALYG
jgi:hypothetical protein